MSSTPTLANGASLRDLRVVKSQVDNTIGSSRITSDQKNYLMAIQSLLSERIVALTLCRYRGHWRHLLNSERKSGYHGKKNQPPKQD